MRRASVVSCGLALLAAGVAVFTPCRASAQGKSPFQAPPPNVLLLVDTSGSMEHMPDGALPVCTPGVAGGSPNRWASVMQGLTGSVQPFFSCGTIHRDGTAPGPNDMSRAAFLDADWKTSLHGALAPGAIYDDGYGLPHHHPLSGSTADSDVCGVFANGKLSGLPGFSTRTFRRDNLATYPWTAGSYTFPNGHAREFDKTSTPSGSECEFLQSDDGQIDVAARFARFGHECGGTMTVEWSFTDNCNRTITHTQIITVDPAPQADWVNPPADASISCEAANSFTALPLGYSNQQAGRCEIAGLTDPVINRNFTECGGTITVSWTFTDECGRAINHLQTIDVEPAATADWVTPPGNITISCVQALTFTPDSAYYTNQSTGTCLITGAIAGTRTGTFDECGGEFIVTWSFTDDCGNFIDHEQTITVDPAPQANWLFLPAVDTTISCSAALGYIGYPLRYSNQAINTCEIAGQVNPDVDANFDVCGGTITLVWEFTDECGRTICHTQNVDVEPAEQGAFVNTPPGDITITCAQALSFTPVDLIISSK